jgi:dTDP-4-dehydrorhamnose reductase
MKHRIFITGGTGFVGGHLLSQVNPEWEVFASYREKKYAFPNVSWCQIDLTDFEKLHQLLQELQPDVILHAAALANLDQVAANPAAGELVNVQVSQNLAGFAEKNHARIVFVSSDMVFDGKKGFYRETDRPQPLNEYGRTKLKTEIWLKNNCSNFVVARSSLVYGSSLTASQSFTEVMLQRWKEQKAVPLFYDQYRSPILVDNLAQALLGLAVSDFTGILHLGCAERVSRLDFGMLFANLLSIRADLIVATSMNAVQSNVLRPADTSFDTSLAKHVLATELLNCHDGIQYWLRNYQI